MVNERTKRNWPTVRKNILHQVAAEIVFAIQSNDTEHSEVYDGVTPDGFEIRIPVYKRESSFKDLRDQVAAMMEEKIGWMLIEAEELDG